MLKEHIHIFCFTFSKIKSTHSPLPFTSVCYQAQEELTQMSVLSLAVQSPSEQADLAQVSLLSSLCQAESHPAPFSATDSADLALQIR